MRIDRHIFGSRDGYKTLAHSPGLTAAECKALESFAFGTPYDPAVRASFAKAPAYWSRPVGRRRRAITRVTLGQPDDAGRPTMLFVTAVVSADDWDDELDGDARALLQRAGLWLWDMTSRLEAIDVGSLKPCTWRLSGPSIQRVLGLVSLIEQSWPSRRPVVIREESYTLDELVAIERLLPPNIRREYSAVYRSLSADIPATVNCVARSVPSDRANEFRESIGPSSPYAALLVREGIAGGRLPESFIANYSKFAAPIQVSHDHLEDETVSNAPPRMTMTTGIRGVLPLIGATAVVMLLIGGAIGWTLHRPPPNPWPEIAGQACTVALFPGPNQISDLTTLQGVIDAKLPDVDPQPDEFRRIRESVNGRKQRAAQIGVAIQAIDTVFDTPTEEIRRETLQEVENAIANAPEDLDSLQPIRRLVDVCKRLIGEKDRQLAGKTAAIATMSQGLTKRIRERLPAANSNAAPGASLMIQVLQDVKNALGDLDPSYRNSEYATGLDEDINVLTKIEEKTVRERQETERAQQNPKSEIDGTDVAFEKILAVFFNKIKADDYSVPTSKDIGTGLRNVISECDQAVQKEVRPALEKLAEWFEKMPDRPTTTQEAPVEKEEKYKGLHKSLQDLIAASKTFVRAEERKQVEQTSQAGKDRGEARRNLSEKLRDHRILVDSIDPGKANP